MRAVHFALIPGAAQPMLSAMDIWPRLASGVIRLALGVIALLAGVLMQFGSSSRVAGWALIGAGVWLIGTAALVMLINRKPRA